MPSITFGYFILIFQESSSKHLNQQCDDVRHEKNKKAMYIYIIIAIDKSTYPSGGIVLCRLHITYESIINVTLYKTLSNIWNRRAGYLIGWVSSFYLIKYHTC